MKSILPQISQIFADFIEYLRLSAKSCGKQKTGVLGVGSSINSFNMKRITRNKYKKEKAFISISLLSIHLVMFGLNIQAQIINTTILIQENETGMVSYDGNIDSNIVGFTGDGYINTENSAGKGITWEICIPANGTYFLQWKYGHGKTGDRTALLMVDGSVTISSVSFQPTGTWDNWDTTTVVSVTLDSGQHLIRLEATNTEGLANIDYISVTGNNPIAGLCPVLVTGVIVSPSDKTIGVKGYEYLSATVQPVNATNQNVTWNSGDTTIATVNSTGLVSALKEGSVNIIVTTDDGSFTDTCVVTTIIVPVYFLETSVKGMGNIVPTIDSIAEGSMICISANPAFGWTFEGWSGDIDVTDNPVCITMDTNKSITANFSENSDDDLIPDGYAGYIGTTGGGDATPITVSTASAFKSAVANSSPAVIIVNGRHNVGDVSIGSNKTIVGSDESSGLYGGTIRVQGSNYIFKNLTFGPASGDVMEVSGGTNVYISKCSFHDAGDEVLSIVRGADFVTVSWCKFYFDNTHSHAFGHLIGNRDDRTSDRGKLHVTMHHNWYAKGIAGRQPRVRYGHVHIYNNYYNSVGSGYCIGVGYECHIRVENTYFEGVNAPWADYGGVSNGEMGWDNLKFVSCNQPTFVKNSFPVFSPPYPYIMDPVNNVKAIVTEGAGNVFSSGHTNLEIEVSITEPADKYVFEYNSDITIKADVSISDGTIDSVQFFYGNSLIGVSRNEPFSVTWENVEAGSYKIMAKAYGNEGKSAVSDIVNITVEEETTSIEMEILGMDLYFNPLSNELIMQGTDELLNDAFLTVYNSYGKIIMKEPVKGEQKINLSNIPEGVYISSLKCRQGSIVRKFIKN